ncbi:hypothetical protein [Shouchella clausii]|uniref:hypothetical protein n=1 Tax=Shouchella clausii TaxID=79880 RepID=UPI001C736F9F|nr:hypothetical protein [Shouchella clausii]MBX0320326.1 hypothetical protein [Shouchella clausii]MEB5480910.1 hypothetical protein [Shouchella clausii]
MSEKGKTTLLREAKNIAHIEGLVKEVRLQEREIKGKNAITGEIEIEVTETEVHPVNFFAYEKTKEGEDNGIFSSLKTVMEEYKTITTHGKEEADAVRVDNGRLEVNDYVDKTGQVRTFPRLSSNFINRVKKDDSFEPKAEFTTEIFIQKISREKDKEGETNRVDLDGVIPVYGGKVVPFSFKVPEDIADYLEDNYEKNQTMEIWGKIVNFKETVSEKTSAGFGQDKIVTKDITKREYLVTGGTDAYDEDSKNAYDKELIKAALAERDLMLENKVEEAKKKKSAKGGAKVGFTSNSGSGSSTNSNTGSSSIDISDDDLPF